MDLIASVLLVNVNAVLLVLAKSVIQPVNVIHASAVRFKLIKNLPELREKASLHTIPYVMNYVQVFYNDLC